MAATQSIVASMRSMRSFLTNYRRKAYCPPAPAPAPSLATANVVQMDLNYLTVLAFFDPFRRHLPPRSSSILMCYKRITWVEWAHTVLGFGSGYGFGHGLGSGGARKYLLNFN